jgi:EpsI family protein
MTKILVALLFLGLNAYVYYELATEQVIPERASFDGFPLQLGQWRCAEREGMEDEILDVLGATDFLVCTFQRASAEGRDMVGVYVGYHASQVREKGGGLSRSAIHTPNHCLPGSGWDVIASDRVQFDLPGMPESPAAVNRIVIAKGEARSLVYYWYQSRGHVIADDYRKIVHLFWDRATRNRTDGSLVRFTVPVIRGDEEAAEAKLRDLAALVVPELPRYVPN